MYLYVANSIVAEIIMAEDPTFPNIPIEARYSEEFLRSCIVVDDDTQVQAGYIYNPATGVFSEPEPEPEPEPLTLTEPKPRTPTLEDRLAALELATLDNTEIQVDQDYRLMCLELNINTDA